MKALLQRVQKASVRVDHQVISHIGPGLLIFLGVHQDDSEKQVDQLVNKIINLRVFPSESSGFDKSALEEQKEILVVSQFTLYGSCQKGRRPDFSEAAKPEQAQNLYNKFVEKIRETGLNVSTGQFQADMKVELLNDGPVTLMIET